jgi:hypothetical protein
MSITGDFRIEITGDDAGVKAMLDHVDYMTSPLQMSAWLVEEVGPWIRERAEHRFQSEGDDMSGPWAALAPMTQLIRATHPDWGVGPDHPINRRTGELEDYIVNSGWRTVVEGMGVVSLMYPGEKPTGELLKKVRTAQKGKPASGSQSATPPRPVLGLTESDFAWIVESLAYRIQEAGAL